MMPNFFGKVATALAWEWCNGLNGHTIVIKSVAALLVIALAMVWIKKLNRRATPPLPPGPWGLPILGNLPFLPSELHQYLAKLTQTYGPIIKLQLGRKTCIVIGSPSLAKAVLKDHDAIFSNRDPPSAAITGSYGGLDLVWVPNGPQWRMLRKLVGHQLMSNARLDASYPLRRRQVEQLVKDINGKVGSAVNVGDQTFITSLNMAMTMIWGDSPLPERSSWLGIEMRKFVMEYIDTVCTPNISDVFPLLSQFDLQGVQSRMKKIMMGFDEIFESVITQRRKVNYLEGKKPNNEEISKDFLQLLLDRGDNCETNPLSVKEIKALVVEIIVAGTYPPSVTMEWAMTELLRNPDKMRMAVEELDRVVGQQNVVEESHLSQLHYLDAVVKETLRLHPPTPLLVTRRPNITSTVAGYTIPKDSRLLFNAWAIQRDPQFWKNPLEFQPHRFFQGKCPQYFGNNFEFFPFGSGRRICAGIPLAQRMIPLVLATMIHSFEWKLGEESIGKVDTKEKFGIVLKKMEPLVAIPSTRTTF